MPIGILTVKLALPGCASLKEKRGRLKPLLARLHSQFNVSAAEMDFQDVWQSALVGVALINSDAVHIRRALREVLRWMENDWRDVQVEADWLEVTGG